MKTKQRAAAYGLALVAMAGALTVMSPQAAMAADISPCDLSKKVQELRAWDTNGKYNIIVWKESARKSSKFNGVQVRGHTRNATCKTVTGDKANYFWMVFRDGEFTRKGDGGYRNWAFSGKFTRNDNHVKFHRR
ncbi:hypothetical protein QNO07_05635 [Streptomyces sp. 549]|uniref:hypothetical protein n=1 Tax=Streptomyces sp. 549 TaxID=3049076 RepID=UPI0024C2F60D|nr:hypothetical protein [Streptomyces sp. 549]MDK1472917.1 hypothetical protein [Streptomyces sp. 549]